MKRAILALPGLLLAASLCMAQNSQSRHQIGTATQEMTQEGLSAAHSQIPVGSKVKIINPTNGLEIEVTIVGEIPDSPDRIIDLSAGAARALDFVPGGPLVVTSLNQRVPAIPEASGRTTTELEVQAIKQPFNITFNSYIISPERVSPPESGQERPSSPNRTEITRTEPDVPVYTAAVPDTPPPQQPQPAQPAQPAAQLAQPVAQPVQPVAQPAAAVPTAVPAAVPAAVPTAPPAVLPEKPSLFTSPPVYDPQIIPGLPDPNTNKIYRLLVGTYPGVDSAFRIYQQLQAAGFDVVQDQAGDMCKVFAAGIPASRVYYAAKRLGAIGFQQVWIQE